MGTVGYMSPEQASGQPLDFRTDQFSLGLVLYEAATGKPAFLKGTIAESLASVLRDDPQPISSVNRQAPAPLCWVIERCLAKNPGERYASTRDLARDLASLRDRVAEAPILPKAIRPSNLPAPRTGFVGREKEVAAVADLLQRPDVQLVTLTGPGGIGKTRLALQVAGELAEAFPGGSYFIPLAAVSEVELVPSAVGHDSGLASVSGPGPARNAQKLFPELAARAHAAAVRQLRAHDRGGIPGGGSAYVESSPQGAGHQPRSAAHLRRTGVSRADAGSSRSQIGGGARCLCSNILRCVCFGSALAQ